MNSYYERNRESLIQKNWENLNKNRKRHQAVMRNYVKKNKARYNEKNKIIKKNKYNSNKQFNAKARQMARHTEFLKNKCDSFQDYVGMTTDEYKKAIEQMLDNDLSWNNYNIKWNIGRKKSKKYFDFTNEKDLKKFFSINNVKINRLYSPKEKRNKHKIVNSYNQSNLKKYLIFSHNRFLKGQCVWFGRYVGMNVDEYKKAIEKMLDNDLSWNNYNIKWIIGRKASKKHFDFTNEKDLKNFYCIDNVKIRRLYNERKEGPSKNKYDSDEQRKLKKQIMARYWYFFNNGNVKSIPIKHYVGMNADEYKKSIEQMLDSDLSWNNYGKKWTIGRIIKRKYFDFNKEKDLKKFFSINNVQINRLDNEQKKMMKK